jgi:chromosome segregation ATPase
MTGEELERTIDFLLKSLATLEARIEQVNTNLVARIEEVNANLGERIARTDEQLARTDRQLAEFADTQADFIRVMTSTWEAQAKVNNSSRAAQRTQEEVNDSFRAAVKTLAENDANLTAVCRELAAAQMRTDETVERLAQTIGRLVDAWGTSGRG